MTSDISVSPPSTLYGLDGQPKSESELDIERKGLNDAEASRKKNELALKLASAQLQASMARAGLVATAWQSGGPTLKMPEGASGELMSLFLNNQQFTTNDIAAKEASRNLEKLSQDKQKMVEDELKALTKWLDDFAETVKNNNASDALSLITKILVPVLATLAVVMSAGAAAPVMALVIATSAYSIAQMVSEETGGPSLSVADAMSQGIAKALQDNGMSEEDAKYYGMALSAAVVLVAAVAMGNAGGASGLVNSAKAATTVAQKASVMMKAFTPLMVALDPKFMANTGAGLTYAVSQAVDKPETEEEKMAAQQRADIVGMVFSVASQVMVGFAGMKLSGGDVGKALKLSAKSAAIAKQMLNQGKTVQAGLTVANGSNEVASGGLQIDKAFKVRSADKSKNDMERLELANDDLGSTETAQKVVELVLKKQQQEEEDKQDRRKATSTLNQHLNRNLAG